ncbi:DNA replication terminus site-binding protein [Salinimonas marina]|nr:DNA replication terminus site-binding protein [Salinimonas marina]
MILLRYYMMRIEEHAEALIQLIHQHGIPQQAIMFAIPRITKAEEQLIIDDDYEVIEVSTVVGQQAINMAAQAFKDMYVYDNDLSRRFVQKYPGLIPLSCEQATIEPVITGLNEAKAAFKAEVQKYEDAEQKFFEVHDRFHYLITTMAYRKVYTFCGNYKAFYFNWSRRPRVETDTRDNWLERIERAKATIPAKHNQYSWYAALEQEKNLVNESRAEKLSIRRPIKLRPECSVRDEEGKMLGHSAGLPFLLTEAEHRPRVSELKNYTRTPVKTRSGKWQLLLPRIHLYEKLP